MYHEDCALYLTCSLTGQSLSVVLPVQKTCLVYCFLSLMGFGLMVFFLLLFLTFFVVVDVVVA